MIPFFNPLHLQKEALLKQILKAIKCIRTIDKYTLKKLLDKTFDKQPHRFFAFLSKEDHLLHMIYVLEVPDSLLSFYQINKFNPLALILLEKYTNYSNVKSHYIIKKPSGQTVNIIAFIGNTPQL